MLHILPGISALVVCAFLVHSSHFLYILKHKVICVMNDYMFTLGLMNYVMLFSLISSSQWTGHEILTINQLWPSLPRASSLVLSCCFFVVVVVFDGGLQGVICAAKNSGSFFGGAMVYLFGDDRYKKGAILFDHINYIVSECLIIFFNLMVSRL